METQERLNLALRERAKALPPEIKRRLECCTGIVVFGSYASGLETKSSDIDVFGIGDAKTHFRTPLIEIMILPEHDLYSPLWLESELANHIAAYGVPLGPRPAWFDSARLGPEAVARKQRRIHAYARSLEKHWEELTPSMRLRYELKVRHELQRLQLLTAGKPIPPTPILDRSFIPDSQRTLVTSSELPTQTKEAILKLFPEAPRLETPAFTRLKRRA